MFRNTWNTIFTSTFNTVEEEKSSNPKLDKKIILVFFTVAFSLIFIQYFGDFKYKIIMNSKIEYSEVINIFIPILILTTVYILQYIYLMDPCEMCINERYPYFILIFIGFFTFLFKKYKNIKFTLVILSTFTILAGAVYTLRHIGIERGFIKSTSTFLLTVSGNKSNSSSTK